METPVPLRQHRCADKLAAGSMLGRYRVEEELGEGGMGAVYRAYDTQLRRVVALKVLRGGDDAGSQAKLLREARAASGLNHPNIIAIYEVGSAAGTDFIAMEFVDGKSLDRVIPPGGVALGQALEWAAQMADGLAKAHSCAIVHRDLKPANVMVTRDGLVKLLDFGLAKAVTAAEADTTLTMTARIAGTPPYMSPEQAQGLEVDTRTDIFSFGAVLYEMLTGRRAFARCPPSIAQQGAAGQEPPPLAGLPLELEKLVSRCLQQDPARRMQHMDDIKLVLRELKEELDSGKSMLVVAPAPQHSRSRWRVGVVAVGLTAAAVAAWWFSHRTAPVAAPGMTRVTFEPGLAFQPSISADGKLVAYTSDRTAVFQIYVQQRRGTQAMQLTHSEEENRTPSFAPDGSKVAYRSEREGGGIYVVDALGGPERRIIGDGFMPRFSPDGSTIAYIVFTSHLAGTAKLALISADGGSPRPFQPDFILPEVGPSHSGPVWSPDGRYIAFDGAPSGDPRRRDWWIAPVADGAAVRLNAPPLGPRFLLRYLEAWRGRYLYYSEGTAVSGMSLYRLPVSAGPWRITGLPQRLTSAGALQMGASLSADGQLVFTSITTAGRLFSLPLRANQGITSGPAEPMPSDAAVKLMLTTAANGSRLAYSANLFSDRTAEIRIRDLASGREDLIAFSGGTLPSNLRLSPDGSRLSYQDTRGGRTQTFVTDPGATTAHPICEGCRLLNFFSNSTEGLVRYGEQLVRQNLATGAREVLLKANAAGIVQASIAPGDRRMAFTIGRPDGTAELYVAPVRHEPILPAEWIPITSEKGRLALPAWSPDGKLLYYSSTRDGFSCVWAQPISASGQPAGRPLAAYHNHQSAGLSTVVGIQFGITPERLYVLSLDLKGNIWSINVGGR